MEKGLTYPGQKLLITRASFVISRQKEDYPVPLQNTITPGSPPFLSLARNPRKQESLIYCQMT